MNKIETTVNPELLLKALHSDSVEFVSTIADLIDNSIFAGKATVINIQVDHVVNQMEVKLAIGDNGCGMSEEIVKEAIRFGAETEKNIDSLSRFGMGLKSPLAYYNVLEILTRKNSRFTYAKLDLSDIVNEKKFVSEITSEENEISTKLIDKYYLLSGRTEGTLILLSSLRESIFPSKMVKEMDEYFGQIYRKKLRDVKININSFSVLPIDPLLSSDPDTYILKAEYYPFSVKHGDENINGNIHVKISILPKGSGALRSQGFYVLYNNREVHSSGWFTPIFEKTTSDLNRLRIQLSLDGEFDKVLGLNYKKNSIVPHSDFLFALNNLIRPDIDAAKKYLARNKETDPTEKIFSAKKMSKAMGVSRGQLVRVNDMNDKYVAKIYIDEEGHPVFQFNDANSYFSKVEA